VAENIEAKAVFEKRVVPKVFGVGNPVVRQLLWAKYEHAAVAQFVLLDDGKSRECLPQANAISENAPVIGFQLVDDANSCVLLKTVQLVPNCTVLIPGALVR
jgi:hypothetical protein